MTAKQTEEKLTEIHKRIGEGQRMMQSARQELQELLCIVRRDAERDARGPARSAVTGRVCTPIWTIGEPLTCVNCQHEQQFAGIECEECGHPIWLEKPQAEAGEGKSVQVCSPDCDHTESMSLSDELNTCAEQTDISPGSADCRVPREHMGEMAGRAEKMEAELRELRRTLKANQHTMVGLEKQAKYPIRIGWTLPDGRGFDTLEQAVAAAKGEAPPKKADPKPWVGMRCPFQSGPVRMGNIASGPYTDEWIVDCQGPGCACWVWHGVNKVDGWCGLVHELPSAMA